MIDKNIGIINYSNNCYLNVIIQLFLSYKDTSNIICNYIDYEKDKNLFSPLELMNLLSNKIDITKQNDSHEVFIQILDKIKELEYFFVNKVQSTYTCQLCNKSRKVMDVFSTFYVHNNSLEGSIKEMIKDEIFELECDYCKDNNNKKKITTTLKKCSIKK